LTSIADGQLRVDGTVGGSLQSPSFDGNAVGESLRIGGASIERVELNGTISGIEGSQIDIAFNAQNIESGRPLASDVSGSVTGIAESHAIEMQIGSAIGQALVHATGSWLDNNWTGEIDQLSFDQMQFGLWELEEPTRVSLSGDSLTVERGCLQQATTRLCLDAAVGGDDERLQLALESFELSALQFLLGERISVAGTYDLEIGLTGPFDRPTGTLAVTGASTLISISDVEAPLDIPIERVAVNATLSEQQFVFSGGIQAAADAGVDFDGTVSDVYADDPAIALQIDGRWADLGFLSLLSPEIGRVSGSATLAVAVGGTFDNPEVSGEARWIDGEIGVPQWGLLVDDVDLLVSTPDQRSLLYAMTGVAGEGRLELQGMT
jgi:autotransporter translocation and assembly factor TamB